MTENSIRTSPSIPTLAEELGDFIFLNWGHDGASDDLAQKIAEGLVKHYGLKREWVSTPANLFGPRDYTARMPEYRITSVDVDLREEGDESS